MDHEQLFQTIGLEPKQSRIYLTLLRLGPSPVRKIAAEAAINRGTTHQVLRELINEGLVSFYHKQKRQYFIAEGPEKLLSLATQKLETIRHAHELLQRELPALGQLRSGHHGRTVVRAYEGSQGVRTVLEEVLEVMKRQQERLYRAYSSLTVRDALHKSFPLFTNERIAAAIFVRVIAIGSGGEHQELSQRRWLATTKIAPTYRIIYADRVAVFSQALETNTVRAVVFEDSAIAATEVLLFDQLWGMLQPIR